MFWIEGGNCISSRYNHLFLGKKWRLANFKDMFIIWKTHCHSTFVKSLHAVWNLMWYFLAEIWILNVSLLKKMTCKPFDMCHVYVAYINFCLYVKLDFRYTLFFKPSFCEKIQHCHNDLSILCTVYNIIGILTNIPDK